MFFKKKAKEEAVQPATSDPCYISRNTFIEGNIICDDEIHVDGAVHGSIRAHTCLIETSGEVVGEILAENVFVRGKVVGPISGRHVHIYTGSQVEGNVSNETISIEVGANVLGNIRRADFNFGLEVESSPSVLDNVLPIKSLRARG